VAGSLMLKPFCLFILTAAIVIAVWSWLGASVSMPQSPLSTGEKLHCISYAPFRGASSPLDRSTTIESWQIEQDLEQLSKVTDCVRTYSVDFGLDRVPDIARKFGLKVMLGLWVSSHQDRTQYQIDIGISLARRFPDVVRAVIVGNEALLRGEVSQQRLAELIRVVKSRVQVPVTYADVWEFWLRHRELSSVVDFVTIHILPYWEDDPVAARDAADHIDAIRRRVAATFTSKEIFIGEVGWPSAGRMRHGALPSPVSQARVIADLLARGKSEGFRVNIIEAYDQPWKRALEGTVGGHWGLFEDATRKQKFSWGEPVTNHPNWRWQAAGGVFLVALIFIAAGVASSRATASPKPGVAAWAAIALTAIAAGVMIGWTAENLAIENLGWGSWLRALAFAFLSIAAPIVAAAALAMSAGTPSFSQVIGARQDIAPGALTYLLGFLAIVLAVLAMQSALALAFDPRYRDFPFAPMTAAALPFVLIGLLTPRPAGKSALSEKCIAVVLGLCAVFIVWNETPANWQALWFAATAGLVALTLARVRVAPNSGTTA
jgi:glucan 1,3-beta-glucosidase